jgi:hypothetical protein
MNKKKRKKIQTKLEPQALKKVAKLNILKEGVKEVRKILMMFGRIKLESPEGHDNFLNKIKRM